MKKCISAMITVLLVLVGCEKSDELPTIKNEIQVKVYNTSTWSVTAGEMEVEIGATVLLVSQSGTVSAQTDNNGIATFSDVKEKGYTLLASKGDLSNLINKNTVDGVLIGNLIVGVYTSQADIDNWATYPNAVVGGIKLADINGDAVINNEDKVAGSYLNFEYKYQDLNADGVINVYDMMNGSLVQMDNVVEKDIYIGK
ncbi:MAG: hypothetical protein PHD30_01850 [Paludibacter sp.]|nr:hypothetical protein [Paludibacter sp.]